MIGMLVRIISKENKKKASVSFPPLLTSLSLSHTNSKSPSIYPSPRLLIHQLRFSHSFSQPAIYLTLPGRYILLRYQTPLPYLTYLMYIRYILDLEGVRFYVSIVS